MALCYPRLVKAARFRETFGASHEDLREFEYDEDAHLTPYAPSAAREDFAETFMTYLRHRGELPSVHDKPAIRRKWRFVRQLAARIDAGRATW